MLKKIVLMLLCLVSVCGVSQKVQATDYSYLTNEPPRIYEPPSLDADGKAKITWLSFVSQPEDEKLIFGYEIEIAKDKEFTKAQRFTSASESLVLDKTVFGSNGGNFYVRVRSSVNITGENSMSAVSPWSEEKEMVFVKINKKNFPGMYKVLKNGGRTSTMEGSEKVVYDKNRDGWLDPEEIEGIYSISTLDEYKKKNGKYQVIKAPVVSSIKGIEYLPQVSRISLAHYSGKKMDLSDNVNIYMVDLRGVSAKQITLNAPHAKIVSVQADEKTKITKIDLSKCNSAVDLLAYGNEGTKTLKLPKTKKNLKVLSLSEYNFKNVNLNNYKNLQQVYFYNCDISSIKVNKCKNLRYIYFYYCNRIKSLDLRSNKKLRGADFYSTPGLTTTTVKRPKNGKYTWNKGKWWYDTKKYSNDMKNLYN